MARPRSEATHQKVLDVAVELVAEVGVSGFTVDAVATRSGIAKSTIYRRWKSSDELLMAALEESVEHLPTPNTGSLRSDLIALYEAVTAMLEQPHVFRTMLGAMARSATDPEFRRLKQGFEDERHQPLWTVLQLAQARGEIAADANIALMVDLVEGPVAARKLLRQDVFAPGEIEEIVDLILAGILPRG